MGIIDDVVKMQKEGKQDDDIFSSLQGRGFSEQEISDALSQTKIKSAVSNPVPFQETRRIETGNPMITQEIEEMEPSMLGQPQEPAPQQPDYQYQDYYTPTISSDTITEIAEQVISEKLSPLSKEIEKSIDIKNTLSTRLDYLDERLKRIERIIDRLQLTILQKVGEYVTNTEDIKKELIETQKSFKSLHDQHKRLKAKH